MIELLKDPSFMTFLVMIVIVVCITFYNSIAEICRSIEFYIKNNNKKD